MSERSPAEQKAIDLFLEPDFQEGFSPAVLGEEERELLDAILHRVISRFSPLTYILGLAIDFTMLAQQVSHHDPDANEFLGDLTEKRLLGRYELVTKRGNKNVNTLSFKLGEKTLGIRAIEEDLCEFFIKADRTGYPSAYVYNTGMWRHHKDLLLDCFKLSESGRYVLVNRLIDFGLERFPKNTYFGRETPRVRLFEEIIRHYTRSGPGENSGMTFQGIAYGYLKADRPHLSLVVDKVRTGSAKQRRFGDIDCYFGLDLEASAEVKDIRINDTNAEAELGQFLRDVANHRVQGLTFVRSIDDATRQGFLAANVHSITNEELLRNVEKWDWRKQDAAVNGLLHFVAHVEQDPKAVRRLLEFIKSRDLEHDSLAHYSEESE